MAEGSSAPNRVRDPLSPLPWGSHGRASWWSGGFCAIPPAAALARRPAAALARRI